MSDWRETARELVESKIVLTTKCLEQCLWTEHPQANGYVPDLTDDATAGVLLGMLARALGVDVYIAMQRVIRLAIYNKGISIWGHAVALALLEVHRG